jgi:uncharacterized peroxidase-related enzyme
MPHIQLSKDLPGILGPFAFRPQTAKPLSQLAETLLRGPSSLTSAERELIAAVVSRGNECVFCCQSHAAASRAHYNDKKTIVDDALKNPQTTSLSPKMRSLLAIALKVRESGRAVEPKHVEAARKEGATDLEIHDTVLVAAAFCMFNRYVDGLATVAPPEGSPAYEPMGVMLATQGYIR